MRSRRIWRCSTRCRNIRKPRRRSAISTHGWISRTARRFTTACCSICSSSPRTKPKRSPSTTGFCGRVTTSNCPSASLDTPSCSKNKIIPTKPSSNTRKPRSREEDALFCWERVAQLDPENFSRQLRLAEAAERMGKTALAARAFLRAGQLASVSGTPAAALNLLGRAYKLAPEERSVGLLYAQANLQAGNAVRAVALLEPFAASESDAAFLTTFSDALMRSGHLERARELLDRVLREKNEGMTQLFELADRYVAAGQDQKATEILLALKRRMFADKRQNDFAALMDGVGAKHPHSQAVLEFWASIHNELNRESQYFEVLIKLFDVYLTSGNIKKAAESLERLVDIDAYDYRNQERLELLRGRVDEVHLKRIASRLLKSGTPTPGHASHTPPPQNANAPSPVSEEGRQLQALEDLIVQTEIFLQYSLQNKALERLQRIAAMFPGEEERNARLSNLYQMANWWPK